MLIVISMTIVCVQFCEQIWVHYITMLMKLTVIIVAETANMTVIGRLILIVILMNIVYVQFF